MSKKEVSKELFFKTAPETFEQYWVSTGNKNLRIGVKAIERGDYLVVSSNGRHGVEAKIFMYDHEYNEVIFVKQFDSTADAVRHVKWLEEVRAGNATIQAVEDTNDG